MTLVGPEGLKKRLASSYCFMGRMRYLRPIELTIEEAAKDIQPFGMYEKDLAAPSKLNIPQSDKLLFD